MKISVVIITRNEEKRIADCLRSVVGCADEVIVLDSFSEDQTVSIAESMGAKVVQQAFAGYGASKNTANELATGDYILSLDADERLDEELRSEIQKIKVSDEPVPAYRLNRLSNYCGQWIRHGGWSTDKKVRFWKKGVGHWNLSEVHEQLILQTGIVPQDLQGNILHYSYATVEEHYRKVEKYAEKGAMEIRRSGKKPGSWKKYVSPAARWFRDYILRKGFLDGKAGWQIARLTAYEVWLKYSKV